MTVMNDDTTTMGVASTDHQWAITTSGNAGTFTQKDWENYLKEFNKQDDKKMVSFGTPYYHRWNIYDDIMKNERSKDMMGLYEVYVVETKKQLFAVDQIIAREARIAERKTNIPNDYNLDDCVFFTNLIGEWESKTPKEVKIIKD